MPLFITLIALSALCLAYGIYTNTFSILTCLEAEDTICLKGQLCRGYSDALLPVKQGTCKYTIIVQNGKIRINHLSFNPDGGTWNLPPQNRQKSHYDIEAGNIRTIELEIGESFDQLDILQVVNPNMSIESAFQYTYFD